MPRRKTIGRRILPVFIVPILLSTLLSSCEMHSLVNHSDSSDSDRVSNSDESPEKESKAASEASVTPSPLFFHPLTGLATDEKTASARPLAILFGNTDSALPQIGLSDADILIEAPTEDGTTKLLLLTCTVKSEKIGPIRTAPPYLGEVSEAFSAVLVHAGQADGATDAPPTGCTVLSAVENAAAFYKEGGRLSPHNIFSTVSRLQNGMKMEGITSVLSENEPYFCFADDKNPLTLSGQVATHIRIDYADGQRTEFRYTPATGVYTRYQNGLVKSDGASGTALSCQNVFILYADSTLTETENGSHLTLSLKNGSGVYATDGSFLEILWYKNDDGRLIFTKKDGLPLTVNPGKSHIEFVKSSMKSSVAIDCN